MTASDNAPGTKHIPSISSLKTESIDHSSHEIPETSLRTFVPGHEELASPDDKKEDFLENFEDNWASDPENPRNWPTHRRWIAMLIVRQIITSMDRYFLTTKLFL